jgi:hypothetical protein
MCHQEHAKITAQTFASSNRTKTTVNTRKPRFNFSLPSSSALFRSLPQQQQQQQQYPAATTTTTTISRSSGAALRFTVVPETSEPINTDFQ